MATRGLGKRERVPVRRIIEEDDDPPQRAKVDKLVTSKTKGGYKCEICGMIFGNGQALGGHKGSHKPSDNYTEEEKRSNTKKGTRAPFQKSSGPKSPPAKPRPVEVPVPQGWACEICGLVFPTGQALGGHKGSHKSTYYYTNLDKGAYRPTTAAVRSARLLERSERRAGGTDKTASDSSDDGELKVRDRMRVKMGAPKGDGFLVRKGTMPMLQRPKDRLQSLAAFVSKRSRRIVSSEEQERGKSSKMIAELLRRTAGKKADMPGGGALSPAGQRGKGMDSFEEDAVAGLMVLRQPIILAGEKGFSSERHRRKRARVKSSPAGAGSNIPERKSDDTSTLEAAKVLVEGNGLLEEDSDGESPSEDEGAFSSGSEERRLLSSLGVGKDSGEEEDKPRRPETRTREERKLTRKLRDSSDEDEVWRPRIRDRTLEAARRAQAGESKKNWGEKKQRPKLRIGLISELVTREGSLPPRAKEGTGGKEGGGKAGPRFKVEKLHSGSSEKSRGGEDGEADSLRVGEIGEKMGGGGGEAR